jgi:hypothetical protein
MFHSGWGTQVMHHRLRTTASRLWLYGTPQRTFIGAVTRLSYPETPGFPRCRLRQVSPCSPHASLHAHQPTCVANVAPSQHAPSVGLSTHFHLQPGHTSISSREPFHGRPTSLLSCCPWSIGHEFAIDRDVRLGRGGELHPPAPSVAQRA